MQAPFIRTLAFWLLVSAICVADDHLIWPQFRGPGGNGVAERDKPPTEFGPEKNVRWKVSAPKGSSSPIIVGKQLVLTAFDNGKLLTIAYDRNDGRELWRNVAPSQTLEEFHITDGSPAASTPVTDGQQIVSYFGSCGLYCYDLSGHELWRYEMKSADTMFGFGSGVSPVIADGIVVLCRDQRNDSKIMAFDVKTGAQLWQTMRLSQASHSTPVVWRTSDGPVVVAPGVGKMSAYDLKTGAEKWWVSGMPAMCCASPVIADGMLFLAAWSPGDDFLPPPFDDLLEMAGDTKLGYLTREGNAKTPLKDFFDNHDTNKDGKVSRDEWDDILKYLTQSKNSILAVKPGGSGDVTASHVVWRSFKAKGLPYVPSMIYFGGQCITVKDGGIVTAYDPRDGKELYLRRLGPAGRYYASPVAANGHIYFSSLDDSVITVMKAGESKLNIVAKNEILERIAATPAIADDVLYIRTDSHLYAFGETQ